MYDIVTIGGVMRDIIFYTDEGLILDYTDDPLIQKIIAFELGAKIYIKKVYFEGGGGANNTAAGFSNLGLKTGAIFCVGQDREGRSLIKEMKKRGTDTAFVQEDKKISTGFSFILSLRRKKGHVIFTYHGANDKLIFPSKLYRSLSTRWLYVSSLSSPNWENILNKIFRFKKKNNLSIAWNPGNVQLYAGYKKLTNYLSITDVLIINEDEAKEIVLSRKKTNNLEVRKLLEYIYKMGPKIVVITVGSKGAYAYDGQKVYYQREMSAKVINATGAGDSFSAGFISSLVYKPDDIRQALCWGVANSTSVIKINGAQRGLLIKNQIIKICKKHLS